MKKALFLSFSVILVTSCGAEDDSERNSHSHSPDLLDTGLFDSEGAPRDLFNEEKEHVDAELNIDLGKSLSLIDGSPAWSIDMETSTPITGNVKSAKYLRVKGELRMPKDVENTTHLLGCLYAELKDNVNFSKKAWLRLTTSGVYSDSPRTLLPLQVDWGGAAKDIPLEESRTYMVLSNFSENSVKTFDNSLCFALDLSEAPPGALSGNIKIQYLIADAEATPPPMDLPILQCTSEPALLRSTQSIDMTWKVNADVGGISVMLAPQQSSYQGSLGRIETLGPRTVRYTAPATVAEPLRILLTARALGVEALPAFCEVNLLPDDDFAGTDDGEIGAVIADVYDFDPGTNDPFPALGSSLGLVSLPSIGIIDRPYSKGCPYMNQPKNKNRSWAIKMRTKLKIEADCACEFAINASDPVRFSIANTVVLEYINPGGQYMAFNPLSRGKYDIEVDFFRKSKKNPKLELLWRKAGDANFVPIPLSFFSRH